MPKRSAQEKIDHYHKKIRRLECKKKKRKRVISSDDEQEIEGRQDQITEEIPPEANAVHLDEVIDSGLNPDSEVQAPTVDIDAPVDTEPDLDPELLLALGEASSDSPDYGPKILETQPKLWLPILKRGLPRESKDNLLKKHIIPENCKLLQAPKLNAEIAAAIPDMVRNRDKNTLCAQQQQLGAGVTAASRAMDLLLLGGDKIEALKHLSDGCRLLTDLHYQFTQGRTKLITPSLDKTCLNVISDAERDVTLFGEKLSEKIKAAKAIEKQGLQIKRVTSQKSTHSTSQQTGTYRIPYQGNWQAPPRYPSNRGGAGREPSPGAASERAAPVQSPCFEPEDRTFEPTTCNTAVVQVHAGRLCYFYNCWLKVTKNATILNWIRTGYSIPFCKEVIQVIVPKNNFSPSEKQEIFLAITK